MELVPGSGREKQVEKREKLSPNRKTVSVESVQNKSFINAICIIFIYRIIKNNCEVYLKGRNMFFI